MSGWNVLRRVFRDFTQDPEWELVVMREEAVRIEDEDGAYEFCERLDERGYGRDTALDILDGVDPDFSHEKTVNEYFGGERRYS